MILEFITNLEGRIVRNIKSPNGFLSIRKSIKCNECEKRATLHDILFHDRITNGEVTQTVLCSYVCPNKHTTVDGDKFLERK